MITLKEGVRTSPKSNVWWHEKRFTCDHCEAVVKLEAGDMGPLGVDNLHRVFYEDDDTNLVFWRCPTCSGVNQEWVHSRTFWIAFWSIIVLAFLALVYAVLGVIT